MLFFCLNHRFVMYASKLLLEHQQTCSHHATRLNYSTMHTVSPAAIFSFKNCTMAIKVKVVGISVLWAAAYAYLKKSCFAQERKFSLFNNTLFCTNVLPLCVAFKTIKRRSALITLCCGISAITPIMRHFENKRMLLVSHHKYYRRCM